MGHLTEAKAIDETAFFVFDAEGRLQDVNEVACRHLSYERKQLLELSVEHIKVKGRDAIICCNNMMHGEERAALCRLIRSDGSVISARTCVQHFTISGKRLFFATAKEEVDPSDRVESIIETQRWSSLGKLSAGIVHDFNNLLMSILGNAEFGLMKLRPENTGYAELEMIQRVGHRLRDLCVRILAYSRSTQNEKVSLTELCSDTISLVEVVLPTNVRIEKVLNFTEPSVMDYTEIQQVLVNAIVNAIDAIGTREGTIYLMTGMQFCSSEFLQTVRLAEEASPGSYVFVEIRDSGAGIPAHVLDQIFDHPVTTKKGGHGLGLTVVAEIVRKHRGFIDLVSITSKGTSFRLFLPIE